MILWPGLIWQMMASSSGSCDALSEFSNVTEGEEFPDYLSNC
jgi:hypothetical protein